MSLLMALPSRRGRGLPPELFYTPLDGTSEKTLEIVLSSASDRNIDFGALCSLLSALGFHERARGSHHIFYRTDVVEIINIQPIGTKAKAYQVRQIRNLVVKYKLRGSI